MNLIAGDVLPRRMGSLLLFSVTAVTIMSVGGYKARAANVVQTGLECVEKEDEAPEVRYYNTGASGNYNDTYDSYFECPVTRPAVPASCASNACYISNAYAYTYDYESGGRNIECRVVACDQSDSCTYNSFYDSYYWKEAVSLGGISSRALTDRYFIECILPDRDGTSIMRLYGYSATVY
jgi:hypothetical protein